MPMVKAYRLLFLISFLFISFSAFSPSDTDESIANLDKLMHFSAFFILSLLLDLSSKSDLMVNKIFLSFLVTYAGLIEIIQYFLPYRSAEILDFIFDLLGILVYLYFAPKIVSRFIRWDIFFYFCCYFRSLRFIH